MPRVLLTKLHPAPWNPRQLKDARFQNLCKSIEADPGLLELRPILATKDGTIYGGNQRFRAVQHLGWTDVPAELSDIPEQLAKERALKDNGAWGEWVDDDLGALLTELKDAGSDIDLLGFDSPELDRLLKGVTQVPEEDEADLTPPVEPITKPGDLWLLGEHRLLCGDSTNITDVERLLDGAKPLLLVTDPPYGVEYDAQWRNDRADKGQIAHAASRVGSVPNDGRVDWREAWAIAPCDVLYCWHAGLTDVRPSIEAAAFEIRAEIIWAKQTFAISRGHYHWQHEACWYAVRAGATATWIGDHSNTTLWPITWDKNVEGGHSTQKPVECMERPIRNHEGDVYDPFVGSGTTVVAAERTSRRCYAMEIDPGYCDVTVARYERLTGKKAVLDGTPAEVLA